MTPATTRAMSTPAHPAVPHIALHVERLVLEGISPGDRYRVAEAFERELSRLIADSIPRSLTQSATARRLDAGQFIAAPGMTPESIGYDIARAVCGAICAPPEQTFRRK